MCRDIRSERPSMQRRWQGEGIQLMSIGWTFEIIREHPSTSGPKLISQLVDVAIEEKDKALETAKHRTREGVVQIVANDELSSNVRLSPGRIRPR
jgi:hypothetical protein